MNTHEEYVTYAQAKALKELGFDWPCLNFYIADVKMTVCHSSRPFPKAENYNHRDVKDNRFSAPTQAVACRWMREEKGLVISLQVNNTLSDWKYSVLEYEDGGMVHADRTLFPSYESALSAGIDRALELLKGNDKDNRD